MAGSYNGVAVPAEGKKIGYADGKYKVLADKFEGKKFNRQQLEEMWARSWNLLESELSKLSDEHLDQRVLIRGHEWTVHEALCRSLAHVSYHVGQLVLVARILKEGEWEWISIPKGYSSEYNQNPTLEKKP